MFFGLKGPERGWGGCLFEFEFEGEGGWVGVGAYSRWALIRGWALIRINTVISTLLVMLPYLGQDQISVEVAQQ